MTSSATKPYNTPRVVDLAAQRREPLLELGALGGEQVNERDLAAMPLLIVTPSGKPSSNSA
jgi:hypothetical protein